MCILLYLGIPQAWENMSVRIATSTTLILQRARVIYEGVYVSIVICIIPEKWKIPPSLKNLSLLGRRTHVIALDDAHLFSMVHRYLLIWEGTAPD